MIPVEVVDYILSFLKSDIGTLKICAKVFPRIADRYLYANMTLCTPIHNEHIPPGIGQRTSHIVNPPLFLDTLTDERHIANYVRTLYIIVRARQKLLPSETTVILSRLSNIKSIFLIGDHNSLLTQWNELDGGFRSAFSESLRLPSLTEASIINIDDFPLSAFEHSESLKRLSLKGKFSEDAGPLSSTYPRLKFLRVSPQVSANRFTSWGEAQTLQSLSVHFRMFDRDNISASFPQIVQAFSGSLVNLEIDFRASMFLTRIDAPVTQLPVSFPVLPLLQHLAIHTPVVGFRLMRSYFSALPIIRNIVHSMPNVNTSTDKILLSIHLQFSLMDQFNIPATSDWSRVVVTLATHPNFRHPVKLYISATDHNGAMKAADIFSIIDKDPDLRKLESEGKLVVEVINV